MNATRFKSLRVSTTAEERLGGADGLLLATHVDHLLDVGLISFEKGGAMHAQATLDARAQDRLRLGHALEDGVGAFLEAQEDYFLEAQEDYLKNTRPRHGASHLAD